MVMFLCFKAYQVFFCQTRILEEEGISFKCVSNKLLAGLKVIPNCDIIMISSEMSSNTNCYLFPTVSKAKNSNQSF